MNVIKINTWRTEPYPEAKSALLTAEAETVLSLVSDWRTMYQAPMPFWYLAAKMNMFYERTIEAVDTLQRLGLAKWQQDTVRLA